MDFFRLHHNKMQELNKSSNNKNLDSDPSITTLLTLGNQLENQSREQLGILIQTVSGMFLNQNTLN